MVGDSQSDPKQLLRPVAQRSKIHPFIVMDVIARAARKHASGQDIIHMEVGQPATPAPQAARSALKACLDRDALGYTEALGMPALREKIALHYQHFYGIEIDPARIVITTGSSAGFLLAFLALCDVGDKVAMPSPSYPCYRQIMSVLGIEPILIETGFAGRWMPTELEVERAIVASGASALLVASPANPTGVMLEPGRLSSLITTSEANKAWFISDEIYHGLTYDFPAETAAAHSQNAIVINSFSKYFSMTGWRIGWMVLPPALVRTVERITQNLFIAAPAPAQVAALGALDAYEELQSNRACYLANRDILIDGLARLGLTNIAPSDGAFYLYADISRFADDSVRFAGTMLDEIGVAVTPGVDFDPKRGRHYLRFSYSTSTPRLIEAVQRMTAWRQFRK